MACYAGCEKGHMTFLRNGNQRRYCGGYLREFQLFRQHKMHYMPLMVFPYREVL